MLLTVVVFIIILGILVLVHEWGHFITARKLGVDVEEFGIGFPPRIIGWQKLTGKKPEPITSTDKIEVKVTDSVIDDNKETDRVVKKSWWRIIRGNKNPEAEDGAETDTIFSLNLIPVGGFVKIKGENGDDEGPGSFANQATWKKSIIISAGVLMNICLAVILFTMAFFTGVPRVLEKDVDLSKVSQHAIVIADIIIGGPADKAGIVIGDKVLSINGQEIINANQAYDLVGANVAKEITIKISRSEEIKEFTLQAEIIDGNQSPKIGVGIADTGIIRYNIFQSFWYGLQYTFSMVILILQALYNLVVNLIAHGKVEAGLSGPVGVAVITGQMVRMGFAYVLQFMAILSVNLAVLNILPFPALDGGRLLFILIEKVRGRKNNAAVEGWIHNSGFILLILLLVFITFRDIGRYGGGILQAIKNLF